MNLLKMLGLTLYLVRDCYFSQIEAYSLIGFRYGYTAFGIAIANKTKRWFPSLRIVVNSHTGQCDQYWLFKVIVGKRFVGYRTRGDAKPWMASFENCGFITRIMLLALIVLFVLASPADACQKCGLFGNRCAFRQVQAVHVQQVVAPLVYPQVNYFVGAPIRVEAIVQQALRADPGYAEYQKFKAWQAGQVLSAQQAQVQPAQQPTDPLNKPTETIPQNIPTAMLTQKCGTCHGGDAPKKGLLLDGTAKLTCEQMAKAMKAIQSGTMPPKSKLTPEESGDIFQDLLDLVETK